VVTASKKDKDISFNTARSCLHFNNVNFGINMISPIADKWQLYYDFQVKGTFNDENNKTINKVKSSQNVITNQRREGYIYVLEGYWALMR
jgi:hypothetical protein